MFATTEKAPIDHHLVKGFVQEGLSFLMPDHIWEEINFAFGEKWNACLGYGGWFYWDEISDFVYACIVSRQILISYEKVDEIVTLMLTYIERNGGFLDNDRR